MLAFGPAEAYFPFLWKLVSLVAGGLLVLVWGLWKFLSPDKAKLTLIALFVIGAASGLTLIGAEFLVRALYSDVTTTADNSSYFANRWREANPQTRNALGFREREFNSRKLPGKLRIAVIGDSFAYGQGISRAERFSDVLEADLRKRGNVAEVLNFSRPGAETVDHIEILKTHVLGIDPDFVLLQWFTNDPLGREKSGAPEYYPLIPSKSASRWLHRNSGLYHLAYGAWVRTQAAMGWKDSYEGYVRRRLDDPNSADSLRSKGELTEFIELAKANKIGVGIVAFPTLSHDQPFSFLIDRVLRVCEDQEIPCLDLRPEFRDHLPISSLHVNRLDKHPSALAHRIAATSILAHYTPIWFEHL
jgi:hypothetical protein